MSLSLHSSMEAFTSSNRGEENDSDMEPEKSSMGEISPRISSRPEMAATPELSLATLSCQASLPISQSKDSVCRANRLGTSSGSRILAKEVRIGAPGIPWTVPVSDLPGRVTAKMRPSEDYVPPLRRPAGQRLPFAAALPPVATRDLHADRQPAGS